MDAPDRNLRDAAEHCFVCGPANPIGLRLRFRIEGEVCRGEYTSGEHHAGFDGVTHGGIVFSVLDDAMANWFFLRGAHGFTAKAEIRYRTPMPIGATAHVECRLTRRKGRLVQLVARAMAADGRVTYAEAEGSFMLARPDDLPDV
jgi:acyl-coenzyme A thioesterase PaaI-like protein